MNIKIRFAVLATVALAAWMSTPARAAMTIVDAVTPPCPIIYDATFSCKPLTMKIGVFAITAITFATFESTFAHADRRNS